MMRMMKMEMIIHEDTCRILDSSVIDKEVKIENPSPTKIDYKSLNVQALREYCITCGVIENGDKKNKKEMLKLLEDMEK